MPNCNGNCAGCSGCARELTLTPQELSFLHTLAQIPFLPVARKMEDLTPVYLEEGREAASRYTLILQLLEKKGLISLDFDTPMKGFSSELYAVYPILGSMALTSRGQQVLEMLEVQGAEEI